MPRRASRCVSERATAVSTASGHKQLPRSLSFRSSTSFRANMVEPMTSKSRSCMSGVQSSQRKQSNRDRPKVEQGHAAVQPAARQVAQALCLGWIIDYWTNSSWAHDRTSFGLESSCEAARPPGEPSQTADDLSWRIASPSFVRISSGMLTDRGAVSASIRQQTAVSSPAATGRPWCANEKP